MYNTNDLAYKLYSGKIKKHSEQLNKYVAGLIDSDGSFSLSYSKMTTGRYGVYLQFNLTQAESADPEHKLLYALRNHYNVGGVHISKHRPLQASESASWVVSGKEALKLLNVIFKHLRIKATHADNLRWIVDSLAGYTISDTEDLKEYVRCSRVNTSWLREPKHLPTAWVAGYIDGDGHYRVRIGRESRGAIRNEVKLFVGAQECDSFILKQLQKEHKGHLSKRKDGLWFWQRSLGKASRSMAVPFLKSMREYCCLPHKYEAIQRALAYHEQITRRD